MNDLRVECTRGDLVESLHRISVAVLDADGQLVAAAGDPHLVTWWRSAAKPFQALPVVRDGAAEAFGFGDDALALACASHSSERVHLEVAERMLRAVGVGEEALACGPHPPLGAAEAQMVARTGMTLTPRWSNCSGKHAAMLALARHHGWPLEGYERQEHPVQQRILAELSEWTGMPAEAIHRSVDGCTAVCFGLPLDAMALAYARLGASNDPSARRIVEAMMAHPNLVGGSGRFCTDLMAGWPGRVIAKVGAEGVYCAALPALRLGVALKVEDGDMRGAPAALHAVLTQLAERTGEDPAPLARLAAAAQCTIRNTRGLVTGVIRAAGVLHFSGALADGPGTGAAAGMR